MEKLTEADRRADVPESADLGNAPPVMFISGATGSIGREIARQAAHAGWHLVLHGRDRQKLADLAQTLSGSAHATATKTVVGDISVGNHIEHIASEALAAFGHIDAVVDCLVTGPRRGRVTGALDDTDPSAYLALAELSVVYLQRLVRAVLPALRETGGCLIKLVSDAGRFPAPKQTLIASARAAEVGFIQNVAAELAREGLRAHCVSLSFVEATSVLARMETSAQERLASARQRAGLGLPSPEDIAPMVLFLCGTGAKKMTGQVISINGGLNI